VFDGLLLLYFSLKHNGMDHTKLKHFFMYGDEIAIIMQSSNLAKISGQVTRHMELCNSELKYSVFLF
jgi:hypothetical protein